MIERTEDFVEIQHDCRWQWPQFRDRVLSLRSGGQVAGLVIMTILVMFLGVHSVPCLWALLWTEYIFFPESLWTYKMFCEYIPPLKLGLFHCWSKDKCVSVELKRVLKLLSPLLHLFLKWWWIQLCYFRKNLPSFSFSDILEKT